ncbi:DNA-binding LacI/PurR family transcriptional regulator [Diaminobutyricimonas aerilata]|uniref:DNA-binding LacI/PurR family transcriptional regulator n=1 Tax=Diaminobutyricimonas aerilata TaxID=1162967 RepID=A0A2M9CNG5_9MICO|nr:LacI family DNA-binding transcriptional regulator [Diaminobutyricimonas aerilata]PJJ73384.1 DNA-binding LacI/PurR family transcriptional regulator [Diaminobutyricimonas aerilata]
MSRRLADVARQVGVSEATVSRVLNAKPGVSEATRNAVLTALDVLGYERPSKLRGDRARLVGLFLPELHNPIFPAFGELVGGGLAQHGYTPVLCTQSAGGITEADYVDLLLQQQVSGVVFVGGQYTQGEAPHDHYARLFDLKIPTVLVNAPVPGLQFPTVSTDDAVAVELAWKHLVQLGHREIGLLLGPADHVPSQRKRAAAERMAKESGLALPDSRIVTTHYNLEAGQAGAARLIAGGATGIICASDPLALGAIRAVRRAGKNVPDDVSVVGFDDSALMNSIDPPLTTVRQPIEPMGRMLIELLVAQLAGGTAVAEEYLFEPELVVRGSTGRAT